MKPLVIVGDALLDVDVEGTADRLCPEAPVPVVDVAREWHRPGGAGLAALLAARSAQEVVLVAPIGADPAGARLTELAERHVHLLALPLAGSTVTKCRVRAAEQSLLRLDSGDGRAADEPLDDRVRAVLSDAAAVLVADYGRGLTHHPGVRAALTEAARSVPVVWDPHPRGATPVPGTTLVTPNEAEARRFTGAAHAEPGELAVALRRQWACGGAAVTRGARGAVLAGPSEEDVCAVPISAAAKVSGAARPDTCGAGDRFASAAASALGAGASLASAVADAVDTAARFVAAGGAAALSVCDGPPVSTGSATTPRSAATRASAFDTVRRVRERGGTVVATGGCFDLLHPGHVALLRQARALGDVLVVCLNSDRSVRELKGEGRPVVSEEDRAKVLRALEPVDDVVIFDEPDPRAVLDRLAPDVWVKGGDYSGAELPEADVVARHGGEVVYIPTVHGYSTTRLVAAATRGD